MNGTQTLLRLSLRALDMSTRALAIWSALLGVAGVLLYLRYFQFAADYKPSNFNVAVRDQVLQISEVMAVLGLTTLALTVILAVARSALHGQHWLPG